jgi:diguanylate cyclase (GGDEF)-like protein
MGMIASIQQHSRRSYLISQSALAGALSASALLAIGLAPAPGATGAAFFSAAAIGTAMFVLHHARQGLYRRLAHVRQLERDRQQLLETDVATGALTRRYFLESLDGALKAGADLTLAVIDIDHFKQLNDSLGHPAGDAALAHLVRCLKKTFSGTIGRLGGDEFALYQTDEDRDALDRRVAAFYALVREPFFHDGRQVSISVSIGLARAANGEELTSLVQHADIALYASKLAGRGRATHFHTEMMTDRRHVRFIERELRAGIFPQPSRTALPADRRCCRRGSRI